MKQNIELIKTDFLVVGSGIAGLYTAFNLSSLGQVVVITKEQIEDSNTQYAQGGIAAVLDKGDSWELHLEDTLKAGAGLCDRQAVQVLVTEGPERVRELIKLGTSFDHIEGELDLTREGAHSKRRILHARGDATGVEIRESLTRVIRENKQIMFKEENFMIDLIIKHGDQQKTVAGVLVYDNQDFCYKIYLAQAVILASGGCGQVYASTSNPDVTTGDGIAAAFRAGANLIDMEFVQFHPTTLFSPEGPSFLISESVRGEGGILLNKEGKRFMDKYHPLAELAPRDVVARSILEEGANYNMTHVWLDVTHFKAGFIEERFPTIFQTLMEYGYDMRKELIPVAPAAHYMMGGIETDTWGQTSLQRLYACGEVACTGVHGANRLASNSLLEGLVFGHRIYETIRDKVTEEQINEYNLFVPEIKPYQDDDAQIDVIREKLRTLMSQKTGIIRNAAGLQEMVKWSEGKLRQLGSDWGGQEIWELENMLLLAKIISRAALHRTESRGGHYRRDHPVEDDDWLLKHVIFNLENPEGKVDVLE